MAFRTPVQPWRTISIAQGNALQIGGLLLGGLLTWYGGRRGRHGSVWMFAGRLFAYFGEHALTHWVVGRLGGIRFTHYGVHGTTHPHLYPRGMRWFFAHLPFLSARLDPASRESAAPSAQAAMYAAGPLVTVLISVAIPLYCWKRGVPRARGLLIGSSVWMVGMLVGELLRSGGDLRRAWHVLQRVEPRIAAR